MKEPVNSRDFNLVYQKILHFVFFFLQWLPNILVAWQWQNFVFDQFESRELKKYIQGRRNRVCRVCSCTPSLCHLAMITIKFCPRKFGS